MKYSLCYFSFFVLMAILFSLPLISAPWTHSNHPETPSRTLRLYCYQWLQFNGFSEGLVDLNLTRSLTRDPRLDRLTFVWSAGYAYTLTNSYIPSLSPYDYCINRRIDNVMVQFLSLERATKTCPEWIFLYGYETNYQYIENRNIALHRAAASDDFISHWAAQYGQFLSTLTERGYESNEIISPQEFCAGLRVPENKLLPFMSQHAPILTCAGWIKAHGFSENGRSNLLLAQQGFRELFADQVHYWAKQFANYTLGFEHPTDKTPLAYCEMNNMARQTVISFFAYVHEVDDDEP